MEKNINKNISKFELTNSIKNLIEYKEYELIKDNYKFNILIGKSENDIIVRTGDYETKLNNNNISLKLDTITDLYEFLINIFNQKKVIIKQLIINEVIILLVKIKEEEDLEIILKHNKKDYKDANENKNETNNIQMLNQLTKDSHTNLPLENIFCIFESIDKIIYLIYPNNNKSIISFNLINIQKINEIKKAHNFDITNLRHYLDKKNKRNIIMSISSFDFNLKLWNIKNYECLLNIKTINVKGHLLLGCFLDDNNNIYIITYNSMTPYNELIRVFDLNGSKIKDIKNYFTFCIDTYYDKKMSKNYIITSNLGFATSYDYSTGEIYHKYLSNDRSEHFSFIINDKKEIIKLIESSYDGNIRIWNFNTGELMKKIYICKNSLYSICLWDNDTLFISSYDKKLRLINLNEGIIINSVSQNSEIISIKKIKHPFYGKCLISQGFGNEQIKMWIVNN